MNAEPVYPVLWINVINVPPGAEDVAAWSVNNVKCKVCTIVTEIYGTTESVVPWLCKCNEIAAANLDKHQTKIVEIKERITSIWYQFR